MRKEFVVYGLEYILTISAAGDVAFSLIGGVSRKGAARKTDIYDLFRDEPRYEDVDLASNSFAVFIKVKQIVLGWVYRTNPWRVAFYATTARKISVYRWIASRVAKNLKGYDLVEAPEGTFSFYKLVSMSA